MRTVRLHEETYGDRQGADEFCLPGTREFGQMIKAAREVHGLTQEKLASRLHTTKQNIAHYENGKVRDGRRVWPMPPFDILVNLALELDIATYRFTPDPSNLEPEAGVQRMGNTNWWCVEIPWTEEDERAMLRSLDEMPTRTRCQHYAKKLTESLYDSGLGKYPAVMLGRQEYECLREIRKINPSYSVRKFDKDILIPRGWRINRETEEEISEEALDAEWVSCWERFVEALGSESDAVLQLIGVDTHGRIGNRHEVLDAMMRVLDVFHLGDDALHLVKTIRHEWGTTTLAEYLSWHVCGPTATGVISVLRNRVNPPTDWEIGDLLRCWCAKVSELERELWEYSEAYAVLERNKELLDAFEMVCRDDGGIWEDYPDGTYRQSAVNAFIEDCSCHGSADYDDLTDLVISEQRKWREERLREAGEVLRKRVATEVEEVIRGSRVPSAWASTSLLRG